MSDVVDSWCGASMSVPLCVKGRTERDVSVLATPDTAQLHMVTALRVTRHSRGSASLRHSPDRPMRASDEKWRSAFSNVIGRPPIDAGEFYIIVVM